MYNALQHSTTLYNILQHTAALCSTHCNTLQHTATLCNTLQHTAAHCNALQRTATHCNALQHATAHQQLELEQHPKFYPRAYFLEFVECPGEGREREQYGCVDINISIYISNQSFIQGRASWSLWNTLLKELIYIYIFIYICYIYICICITSEVSFEGVPPGVGGMPC
jgi:hypothetical protein